EQFRQFLKGASSDSLATYVEHCLSHSFDKSGQALQDVVNELGRRLDFSVVNGLYQGRSNAVGFDGIWDMTDGRSLVVEVKTTDTYRINLDTISDYRKKLIASSKITDSSSI